MESLEQLLHELDSRWQREVAPNLRSLLRRADSLVIAASAEACAELCAADLEWRWRVHRDETEKQERLDVVGLPARPSANDYSDLLGGHWESEDCRARMLQTEWIARSAWGDRPHVDRFCESSGLPMSQAPMFADQLGLICPLVGTVINSERVCLECQLPSQFTVGRQRPHEPAPPAWLAADRRLVIAASDHRSFSREQLTVRRTRTHEIEICNQSRKVVLHLNLGVLQPGKKAAQLLPFRLRANSLELMLSAAAQGR